MPQLRTTISTLTKEFSEQLADQVIGAIKENFSDLLSGKKLTFDSPIILPRPRHRRPKAKPAAQPAIAAVPNKPAPVPVKQSVVHKPRKNPPPQLCPVPGCRKRAAPRFGMVCSNHKDVPKPKIREFRALRRAKNMGLKHVAKPQVAKPQVAKPQVANKPHVVAKTETKPKPKVTIRAKKS